MAITYTNYFSTVTPAAYDPFDNNIQEYLPALSDREPVYTTPEAWGWCQKVYYNENNSNIRISNAFISEVTPGNLPEGVVRRIFAIPFQTGPEALPVCYLSAAAKHPSSSILQYFFGLYSDDQESTQYGSGSINNISSTATKLKVGAGFFEIPGRDDPHLYPNPWERYVIAAWFVDGDVWVSDDFVLKTELDEFGYYLTANSGVSSNVWFLDLHNFALNNNNIGPYDAFLSDYSPEAGPASEPGGYGEEGDNPSFDDSSDTIDVPADPTIGVSSVGFVNVYKTGTQSLQNMGVELFPPLAYTPPTPITGATPAEALVNGFNQFITFLANIPSFLDQITASTLINYIIDCHVIPVTPSGGSTEHIKVGSKTLNVQGLRLSNDYVTFDCGTISLSEYYANFADYLTTMKLYLPFVGFVPARPEWFYRESLNVTYKFNVVDGSFMAYVRSTGKYVNNNNQGKTIVGQYGGNACVHLPITGVTYASMVSGLIGAGAGAIAGAATGNIAAVATSAIGAAGQHGDIAQSNQYSSSVAFLGCRRPFVLIERPVSNFSKTFVKERGLPSNISKKLSNVSGFAIVGKVHLDGITATDAEKAEIERLLNEGVIL